MNIKKMLIVTSALLIGNLLMASEVKSEINNVNTLVNELKASDKTNEILSGVANPAKPIASVLDTKEEQAKVLDIVSLNHNIPRNFLSIGSFDFIEKENLKQYTFKVEGYEIQGVVFVTKDGLYLMNDFYNQEGKNLFKENFLSINKESFEKEMENKKAETSGASLKVAAYIKDIEAGKYGDVIRTLSGDKTKKETLYVFTDLTCPYCKMYEEGRGTNNELVENYGMRYDLTQYREIKVIMYPLYMIPGHESSIQRSLWFNNESKKVKDSSKILELMNKATNAQIEDLKVNEKELATYDAFIKNKKTGLMSTGVVQGTPSMFLKDGTDPRLK